MSYYALTLGTMAYEPDTQEAETERMAMSLRLAWATFVTFEASLYCTVASSLGKALTE